MLGLKESGEVDLIEDIVKNFASLIDRYGFIPNGNRTYYLSRSQPPYFSMMVEVLAGLEGDSIYVDNLSALEKEYAYWTDQTAPTKHPTRKTWPRAKRRRRTRRRCTGIYVQRQKADGISAVDGLPTVTFLAQSKPLI